ncbi:MAG TPA: NrfD/PsrC family molybdoenzyme membrane anchor subunit [Burkholderiaceae bacterium]|nr:NrfD/PsrC family molybdoenzyme membrane anchor subunit [Burkholderiaceae bacterium]
MRASRFPRIEQRVFWLLVAAGALLTAAGLGAAHRIEERGHAVTGMSNQVVWGVPHVFAIFLIVAASGVLNVASIGSVFGKPVYKARAPLSGLLSLAMLAGGLMVLMLDLGRPERVVVAATHFNFRSVFAWNVFLYSGMFAIVTAYLWTMMERRMTPYSKLAGLAAFFWRFVLTTGTGSIFGFLVARQAYQSALLAPMFIVLSFGWGLAVFLIVQSFIYAWNGMRLPPAVQTRMARLLGVFVLASLYFVAIYHLTNLYWARQHAFERFILLDGGTLTWLFWSGYVVVGSVLPAAVLFSPLPRGRRAAVVASGMVVIGAFAQLYVFIVGGQAFPLEIFPGFSASSEFFDGAIASYVPKLPEFVLGLGGIGAAFLLTAIGVRALHFVPEDDFLTGPTTPATQD